MSPQFANSFDDDHELDISILDAGNPDQVIVLARSRHEVAIEPLPLQPLNDLAPERIKIERAITNEGEPLQAGALHEFGQRLFELTVPGRIYDLYLGMPRQSHVRIRILSNSPVVQSLPWEFWQQRHDVAGPRRLRSVVRLVHPSIGLAPPPPLSLSDPQRQVKILFVAADPVDQTPVSWEDVRRYIVRTFETGLPGRYLFRAVSGLNRVTLRQELEKDNYDILHFVGHGEVIDGVGHLVLQRQRNDESSRMASPLVCQLLRDARLRLVVLSACKTSAGNMVSPYAVIAEGLVALGVPAVVANQFSLPDRTVADFVRVLYEELLRSGDIDLAVSTARVALANDLAETRPRGQAVPEWGICTLHRHARGAKIFHVS